jgi:hypothetical protein
MRSAGRAWSAPERIQLAGVTGIAALELTLGPAGAPMLVALASAADSTISGRRWWRAAWAETSWAAPFAVAGRGDAGPGVIASAVRSPRLAWLEREPRDPLASRLLIALLGSGATRADTAAITTDQASGFGAAVGQARIWVVRSQQRDARTPGRVPAVANGGVSELPRGDATFGCAVSAPRDRAIVVGRRVGLALGNRDALAVADQTHSVRAWVARVALRAAARGRRVARVDGQSVHVAAFDESAGFRMRASAAHPAAISGELERRESGQRPPRIVWGDRGDQTARDCLCAAFPTPARGGAARSARPTAHSCPPSRAMCSARRGSRGCATRVRRLR